MFPFFSILFLILTALALPAALGAKSWPRFFLRFFVALVLSFFGVVLPLYVFFFSSFMAPGWKGACNFGWVDCFIVGKLALTPFVLMATAALYKVDVLRPSSGTERWVVVSVFLGTLVAVICLVFGLVCLSWQRFMLVPFYVAIWQACLAARLMETARLSIRTYLGALLGSLPFWLASVVWSRRLFESLPDKAPSGCFVVTAASHGHARWVGPFVATTRYGRHRQVNEQLLTFWQFEELWRAQAPHSHRIFRRGYNQLGPMIAARIRSPWLADAAWLALKPAEWLAKLCLHRNTTLPE